MSRRKLKARDKTIQKMSRDGVVQINAVIGDEQSISKREADFELRGDTPERETLSQVGTRLNRLGKSTEQPVQTSRLDGKSKLINEKPNSHKKSSQRHIESLRKQEITPQKNDTTPVITQNNIEQPHNTLETPQHQIAAAPSVNPREPPNQTDGASIIKAEPPVDASQNANVGEMKPIFEETVIKPVHTATLNEPRGTGKLKTQKNTAYQEQQPTAIQHETDSDASPLKHQSEKLTFSENKAERPIAPKQIGGKPIKRKNAKYQQKHSSTMKHEPQKADSTITHGKDVTPSAAAPVIQPDSKSKFKAQRETVLHHNQSELKTDSQPLTFDTPKSDASQATSTAQTDTEKISDTVDKPHDVPQNRPTVPTNNQHNPIIWQSRKGKFKQNRDTVYQFNKPDVLNHEPQKTDTPLAHKSETTQTKSAETEKAAYSPQYPEETPRNPIKQSNPPLSEQTADTSQPPAETTDNSAEQPELSEQDAPVNHEAETGETEQPSADDTLTGNKPVKGDKSDSSFKQDKSSKLRFSNDETAPGKSDKKPNRKLEKAERQAEQAGKKLEKVKNKLPAKRKLRSERVFDEKKGKAKRKLYFEKEVKSQGQHLKGALPLRPVKAAGNTLMLKAHSKIYQVEHENVAVKAAHRVEMIGEAGVRSALRHHKTAPYRKVAKLEKQAAKKTIKLNYQKALADNPKLSSNVFSRMWQKRKIKKDYAKAARDAQKAAKAVKKAGSVTSEAAKLLAGVIRRHPIATVVIILIALLLFMLMSLIGLGGGIGSGGFNAILSSSYLAEDADIEQTELSYSEWETDLQFQILNAESSHPGYDEYRYDIGDISHNPYELIAYLTAVYQNFTYDGISSELQALFNEQYSLTFTEMTEIRYADPTDANEDGDYEPYEWKILTVKLTARSFSDVILSKMTADQQVHYALLMQTKGNRQYAGNPFDVGWLPYVTSYYGYRVHPITGVKDLHRGIDIALSAGTPIKSTQDGTVTFAGYNGGYGNVVIIENDKGITTKYAHCDTISVSEGQTVSMGDVIATVGNTGDSTGAHLHYEVLKDGEYLNPAFFADTGNFSLIPSYGTPGTPMGDGSYAALIAEAELHLGKPYVFGSNGTDSFDCSSFICYILTQSGVKNMPRTTAQGIYNQSNPIPASERQPGDLVFFHSTYSTVNTITHVALYVGAGWIIHAGSPVQYTQIDGNSYWQAHLYSYGRLN